MKKSNLAYLLWLALFIPFGYTCQVNTYEQGQILYQNFCANCHGDEGEGLVGIIPPLAGADFLGLYSEQLPCIIRYGMSGEITVNGRTYDTEMAGIPKLTEFEITNVINYINTAWGNDFEIVKHLDVRRALEACEAERRK